jgi:hypothetical protein
MDGRQSPEKKERPKKKGYTKQEMADIRNWAKNGGEPPKFYSPPKKPEKQISRVVK